MDNEVHMSMKGIQSRALNCTSTCTHIFDMETNLKKHDLPVQRFALLIHYRPLFASANLTISGWMD